MDKKLKIGVIGAGGIATHAHMPGYSRMENVDDANFKFFVHIE